MFARLHSPPRTRRLAVTPSRLRASAAYNPWACRAPTTASARSSSIARRTASFATTAVVDLTPKLLDLLLHLLDNAGDAGHQGSAARRAVARRQRHRQRAGAGRVRAAAGARRRGGRSALHQDRRAPRLPLHRAGRARRAADAASAGTQAERRADAGRQRRRSIAVLDFTNVTGDPESAWLSAGIAETVSGDLRALGRFRVVDRWRVMEAARRTGGSMHDVAAALARARSSSSAASSGNGDRIRITRASSTSRAAKRSPTPRSTARSTRSSSCRTRWSAQFARGAGRGVAARGAGACTPRETPSLEAYRAVHRRLAAARDARRARDAARDRRLRARHRRSIARYALA